MLIKILYVIAIFLIVRLVVNNLKKFNELQNQANQQAKKKRQDDDIIDAEYTVINEKKRQ